MSPTCGLVRMLVNPSTRRLPARSGMAIVVSSRIMVNPAGSPLGETSQVPSAAEVAMRQNGDAASHCVSSSCSSLRVLPAAAASGVGTTSRSSSYVVISTSPGISIRRRSPLPGPLRCGPSPCRPSYGGTSRTTGPQEECSDRDPADRTPPEYDGCEQRRTEHPGDGRTGAEEALVLPLLVGRCESEADLPRSGRKLHLAKGQ